MAKKSFIFVFSASGVLVNVRTLVSQKLNRVQIWQNILTHAKPAKKLILKNNE